MPDIPDIPAIPPNEADQPLPSPRRTHRYLLVAAINIAVPLILLLSIEAILRTAGIGTDTHYLQRHEFDGVAYFSPNRAFFDQFSTLPMEKITNWDCMEWLARPEKAPDTYRIVLFGESAVYGTPYPEFGFPRYLQAMLEAAFPGKKIELINAACPGINTFTMQAVAHAICPALKPDACIVYAGNNEGCMPYSPDTFIGGNALLSRPAMVRAHMDLLGLRITQSGLSAMQRAGALDAVPLQYSSGKPSEDMLARYRCNLTDMAESARESGAEVWLCTLGRNRHLEGAPVDTYHGAPINRAEPFPAPYNAIVEEVAQTAHLVDIETAMEARCSAGYLPAYNFFTDLVHLNFEGNYVVASTLFMALHKNIAERFGLANLALPLSPEETEKRLGLSPEAKVRLNEALTKGMAPSDCEAARQWMERYRQPDAPGEIETLREALNGNPGDPILYSALYSAYSQSGEYQRSLDVAREYQRQFPVRRGAHAMQAEALFLKDMVDEAKGEARAELERYPDDIRANRVLARIGEQK